MNTYQGQPARPTTYRGIQMRSRTEARVAAFLDAEQYAWTYEPQAFANEHGQYLPDFRLDNSTLKPCYIEVRPTVELAYHAMPRMQIIWDSEPTAVLLIFAVSDEVCFIVNPATGRRWESFRVVF